MPAPRAHEVLASIDAERLERLVLAVARPDDGGQYRHWETFRRVRPPDGFSVAEWWFAVRQARRAIAVALPLTTGSRQPFTVSMPPAAHEMARLVERRASGQIVTPAVVTDPRTRDRYIVSALIEEAITSSQLEGASTTRRVAKQMLRSGRPPRTHAERMILGNHRAMEYVRRQGDRALTPPAVLDLHRVIGEGSIEDGELGRLQTAADERVAVYWDDGVLLHQPPPADQLPDRLERLCAFANGRPVDGYLHPVVRAILVHFWLAHDHPFADGNGRTARALFYWTMLREGYWLTEFISISRILRAAPSHVRIGPSRSAGPRGARVPRAAQGRPPAHVPTGARSFGALVVNTELTPSGRRPGPPLWRLVDRDRPEHGGDKQAAQQRFVAKGPEGPSGRRRRPRRRQPRDRPGAPRPRPPDSARDPAAAAIVAQGLTLNAFRQALTAALPEPAGDIPDLIPFDAGARKALELTFREALRLGHDTIGPEHPLLALLELEASEGPSPPSASKRPAPRPASPPPWPPPRRTGRSADLGTQQQTIFMTSRWSESMAIGLLGHMRRHEETHPWITFSATGFNDLDPTLWMLLGEARSKCQHLAGTPLAPEVGGRVDGQNAARLEGQQRRDQGLPAPDG